MKNYMACVSNNLDLNPVYLINEVDEKAKRASLKVIKECS